MPEVVLGERLGEAVGGLESREDLGRLRGDCTANPRVSVRLRDVDVDLPLAVLGQVQVVVPVGPRELAENPGPGGVIVAEVLDDPVTVEIILDRVEPRLGGGKVLTLEARCAALDTRSAGGAVLTVTFDFSRER